MSDDADNADQRIADAVADGIQAARRALESSLKAIGVCHFCESAIAPGHLFCCQECGDDYEHERKRRKAQGL